MMTAESGIKEERMSSNPIIAVIRLFLLVIISFLWLGSYLIFPVFLRPGKTRFILSDKWLCSWSKICCRLLGYRVHVLGNIPTGGVFLAPNHLGYADIPALTSVVPCFFAAKSEVASWPIFGWGASLFNHFFIERKSSRSWLKQSRKIADRMCSGWNVCIFLEGTSSGGNAVGKFHSSFLQPAINAAVPVVPVALKWKSENPLINVSEDIAYWKDHNFGAHFFRHAGLNGVEVDIVFGDPLTTAGKNRKDLCEEVHCAVSRLYKGDRVTVARILQR